MTNFMDEIVEAVEQFIEGAAENAIIILGILAKGLILITTPVWILPYKAIRARHSYAKEVTKIGKYVEAGLKAGSESVEKPRWEMSERGKEDAEKRD